MDGEDTVGKLEKVQVHKESGSLPDSCLFTVRSIHLLKAEKDLCWAAAEE